MLTKTVKHEPLESAEPLFQKIGSYLAQEKQRIFDEILSYPPPIPACDVQFNFLLAERTEMMQALQRLREISGGDILSLRKFIRTCKFFDNALQTKLLAEAEGVLDE